MLEVDLNLAGKKCFLIGIKGTGMSSLAVILKKAGAFVTGCDSNEVFPTDQLLEDAEICFASGFGADLLMEDADFLIYSDAYGRENCPVLAVALSRFFDRCHSYPQFLALLSSMCRTYGVAGTHGKTTTTAAAGWLLSQGKRKQFPLFAVMGSAVAGEGAICNGTDEMLIEACEYRDHFLSYDLRGVLITSIEMDHPDWFADENAVCRSFEKLVKGLSKGGVVILCVDDPNVRKLSKWVECNRKDLICVEYGFSSQSAFRIRRSGKAYSIDLVPYVTFALNAMSDPIICDYFGAAILASSILLDRSNPRLFLDDSALVCDEILGTLVGSMMKEMELFPGVRSRNEVVAQENGIVYIDDYAHHPTEIRVCLDNLRRSYPGRRLCVAFSPHTYSRTSALMEEFVAALAMANVVVVQKTYASARGETADSDNARELAEKLSSRISRSLYGCLESAVYIEYDEDAAAFLADALGQNGVCISLGAGNNRPLLGRIIELRRGDGR